MVREYIGNPHIKDAVKDYTLKLISLAETPSTIDDTVNNSINRYEM